MFRLKSLAMLLFVLVVGVKASAGLYLNPYISYEAGLWNSKLGSATGPLEGQTLAMGVSGSSFGLVAAYSLPALVYFGVDYNTGSLAMTVKDNPLGAAVEAENVTHTALYGIVGVKLMIIKLWAGVTLQDDFKDSNGTTTASGTKVGLAWSMLPLIDLNFEYTMHNVKKMDGEEMGSDKTFASSAYNTLSVGVSVPFNF